MPKSIFFILAVVIGLTGSVWAEELEMAMHPMEKIEGGLEFIPICPQPRKTVQAPDEFYNKNNPLPPTPENIFAGQTLFHFDARPTPCRVCHGISGNGLGVLFRRVSPKPRNFTCNQTMENIPDGQLFWIIRNGSVGTAMPAFKLLDEDQIWQLIHYIRHFTGKEEHKE